MWRLREFPASGPLRGTAGQFGIFLIRWTGREQLRSHRINTIAKNIIIFMRAPRLRAPRGARRGRLPESRMKRSWRPPRERPAGGGGTYHNRGYGGITPHHSPRKISISWEIIGYQSWRSRERSAEPQRASEQYEGFQQSRKKSPSRNMGDLIYG